MVHAQCRTHCVGTGPGHPPHSQVGGKRQQRQEGSANHQHEIHLRGGWHGWTGAVEAMTQPLLGEAAQNLAVGETDLELPNGVPTKVDTGTGENWLQAH